MFVETPLNNQILKEEIVIQQLTTNSQKLEIRNTTLTSYENFKKTYKILQIKVKLVEDKLQMFEEYETKFINGEIDLEKLTQISQLYDNSLENKIEAEYQLRKARIDIEALIGINLEEVPGYFEEINALNSEIR